MQSLIRDLFEYKHSIRILSEMVEVHDKDNILLNMNPSTIPMEKAIEMHQWSRWTELRDRYKPGE